MARFFPYLLIVGAISFFAGTGSFPVLAQDNPDPSEQWASAIGWVQTGENLVANEQPALALASYIEGLRQLQQVADRFPQFEPEIVTYRLDALKARIEDLNESLSSDEHDITMGYLDFVESLEKGIAQRKDNDFKGALETLQFAQTLLESIYLNRSEKLEKALSSQHDRLADSINWLDSQVNRKPVASAAPYVPMPQDATNWGTTSFIKPTDLPNNPQVKPTGVLFPDELVAQLTPKINALLGTPTTVKKQDAEKEAAVPEKKENTRESFFNRLPKSFGPGKRSPETSEPTPPKPTESPAN